MTWVVVLIGLTTGSIVSEQLLGVGDVAEAICIKQSHTLAFWYNRDHSTQAQVRGECRQRQADLPQ